MIAFGLDYILFKENQYNLRDFTVIASDIPLAFILSIKTMILICFPIKVTHPQAQTFTVLTLLMLSFKNGILKLTSIQPQICSGPFNIHFSTYLLVDPNEREERVMDGLLVIAMNKHREICTIQSSGGIMLLKDQVSALINVLLRIGLFFLEAFSCFLTKSYQGYFLFFFF